MKLQGLAQRGGQEGRLNLPCPGLMWEALQLLPQVLLELGLLLSSGKHFLFERPLCWFPPQMLTTARLKPGASEVPGRCGRVGVAGWSLSPRTRVAKEEL